MVSRKITVDEFALSLSEISSLQVIAGVSCEGCACIDCPFHIEYDDICLVDKSQQILKNQNIPYVNHPIEKV